MLKLHLAIGLALCTGLLASSTLALPVGSAAPAFTLQDQNGNDVSLSDFQGTGVILDFCTIWCTSCQQFYQDVHAGIDGAALVVPVVSQAQSGAASGQSDAAAWSSAFGLPTSLHFGGDETAMQAMLAAFLGDLPVAAFPTFVFIDADLNAVGNIIGNPGQTTPEWAGYVSTILASQSVPEPNLAVLLLATFGIVGRLRSGRSGLLPSRISRRASSGVVRA